MGLGVNVDLVGIGSTGEKLAEHAPIQPIAELELWDVTIDGQATSAPDVLAQWPHGETNLALGPDEDRLVCTIPCAMGTQPGAWSFAAGADGYAPTTASAEAAYAVQQGGCPSFSDGGTRVAIELAAE